MPRDSLFPALFALIVVFPACDVGPTSNDESPLHFQDAAGTQTVDGGVVGGVDGAVSTIDAGVSRIDAGTTDRDATPNSTSDGGVTDDEIAAIFAIHCTDGCHNARSTTMNLLPPFRDDLVDVLTEGFGRCYAGHPIPRVRPGSRTESYLWQKITGTQTCGNPMPIGRRAPPLTPDEIETIGRWIDEL